MRPRSLLPALLAVLLFSLPGWCQRTSVPVKPGEIRGQVRLPDGRVAPVGVPVSLIHREGDSVAEGQTDRAGKFSFSQIQPGIYRIRIHAMGYLDIETQDLDLNLSSMQYLNLDLKPDPNYKSPFATAAPGGVVSAEELNAPEGARKDLASGKELLEKGTDYPKSIEFFKKAISAYPKYSEAYLMMGIAYRAQNNLEQAGASLRKCLEINANSGPAYIGLGEIQNQQQDYAGAEKSLVKAVALMPNSPQGHVELARTLWAQKRYQEAEPHVQKALTLAPDNAAAHLLMGNVEMHNRNGQAALQQFREYLRLDPNGAMAPQVRDLVGKLEQALGPSQSQTPTPTPPTLSR